MAIRKKNSMINAEADYVADLFAGGTLEIYSGAQPADPNSAPSGTLLATIDLPDPAFGAAAGGVISKSGTWQGSVVSTATAGWGRFISADETTSFDVSIGEAATDLIIDDEDLVTGGIVTVTAFTFTVPNGV